MLTLKLQINKHMAERYPDKDPEEKYRMILSRDSNGISLYFYFTRDELYEYVDQLVNLVSKLPMIEDNDNLSSLEAVIKPTAKPRKVTRRS